MKKVLIVVAIILALVVGGFWYLISNAGVLIKQQIEQQGSAYLGTSVVVANVDLALSDGRLTISGLQVANPEGYSDQIAFSLNELTFDLGTLVEEPYTIQTVSINAPEILYEVDESGKGNLLVLKDTLMSKLPASEEPPAEQAPGANPLVIVEDVSVSNVRLKLDFEKINTGDLNIEQKAYEVTLPTFSAGSVGKPNGLPADQVGGAIVSKMLDNVIAQAKEEAKKRAVEEAKKKAKEKLDEEKDKLLDKAGDKLKGLFDN